MGKLERRSEHGPGRRIYDISYSPTNPELLCTGSNEGGLYHDGILCTCGGEIVNSYAGGNDEDGSMGILFNPPPSGPGRWTVPARRRNSWPARASR